MTKEKKLKTKVCPVHDCGATLIRCDRLGRPGRTGEWRVCPEALKDFTRDELGFWTRKYGAKHKEVVVSRPEGWAGKVRREVEAVSPPLFPEEEWNGLFRKKAYKPKLSELRRGQE